jgi:hypothetical protein
MRNYYISIPYYCYMFRCISHHLQGELTCFLLKTICFYTAILYGTLAESSQIKDTSLLFFFFLWRYGPFSLALDSLIIDAHSSLSNVFTLHRFTPSFLKSSSTSSIHLSLCRIQLCWFTIFLKWFKSYVLHAILYVTSLKNLVDVIEETSNIGKCMEWNTS